MTTKGTQVSLFQPTQISGCQLWLDAADSSSVTVVGGTVTKVNDKSANNVNLSNATGFTYPNNTFNGTYPSFLNTVEASTSVLGDNAAFTLSQPLTTFFVGRKLNTSNYYNGYIIDGTSSRVAIIGGKYEMFAGSLVQAVPDWVNVNLINSSIFNTTNSSGYINGSLLQTGNVGTNSLSGLRVGNRFTTNDNWTGHICEFLIFSGAMGTSQRQQIEGYLAWKWGLQGSLPATHPYKNTPIYSTPPFPLVPRVAGVTNSAVFAPTQISGCALWLDAADTTSYSLTSGNLSTWRDKSSNGYTCTPVSGNTISTTTQNGLNVFYMNNTRATIPNFVWSNQYTFLAVMRPAVNAGFMVSQQTAAYINYILTQNWELMNVNANGLILRDSVNAQGVPVVASNAYSIFSIGYNSGTSASNYAVNGTTRSTQVILGGAVSPGSNTSTLWINGQSTTAFDSTYVAEIIHYNTSITTAQRQQVEGYLAWKWGLTASLPNGHPFKTPAVAPFSYGVRAAQQNKWQPTQVSGCQLWLDAADPNANGSVPSNGSTISVWRDKSGNANNGTSGGSIAATYSSRSIVFSGTQNVNSTYFSIPDTAALRLTTPYTIYMSYSATALTPTAGNDRASMILLGKFPEGSGYPGWAYRARTFDPTNVVFTAQYFNSAANQGDVVLTSVNVVDGTQKIIGLYQPGTTTMFTRVNGSPDLTLTMNLPITSTVPLIVGARNSDGVTRNPFNGSVNEILIFTSSLTLSDCQQIEGYLAWKWGLQGNLPATHPYKKWPPSP